MMDAGLAGTDVEWCLKVDEVATALRHREFQVAGSSAALSTFIDSTASRQIACSGYNSAAC